MEKSGSVFDVKKLRGEQRVKLRVELGILQVVILK